MNEEALRFLANVGGDAIKQLARTHFKLSLIRPDGLAARLGAARTRLAPVHLITTANICVGNKDDC